MAGSGTLKPNIFKWGKNTFFRFARFNYREKAVFFICGSGGVIGGLVPKKAEIGSEVDFSQMAKKCHTGQGGQK